VVKKGGIAMRARSFSLRKRGADHIIKNKVCQDYSVDYSDGNCAVVIVCDGHGGDDYVRSELGARFACEIARENICDFVKKMKPELLFEDREQHMRRLKESIIAGWNGTVREHYSTHPFEEGAGELAAVSEKARKKYREGRIESAYGTTLIAVAVTGDYWFGLQIGDGKCVAVDKDSIFSMPVPWDDDCFFNMTTSMCDADAINHFRHYCSRELPAAVLIGSDGVDGCFSSDEKLYRFYTTVLYSFGTTEFEEATKELGDYLPRLSAKGSGDDVSIAAVFDMDVISKLRIVREFDREKERAKVEEAARAEAQRQEAQHRKAEEENGQQEARGRKLGMLHRLGKDRGEKERHPLGIEGGELETYPFEIEYVEKKTHQFEEECE